MHGSYVVRNLPSRKLQLTVNGLPAYTFVGDKAGVVKCNGIDGWFRVRPAPSKPLRSGELFALVDDQTNARADVRERVGSNLLTDLARVRGLECLL